MNWTGILAAALGSVLATLVVMVIQSFSKVRACEVQISNCEKEIERQDAERHALGVTVHQTAKDVQGLLSKEELRIELERNKR